jgi:site-specific recombinase XerD
MYSTKERNWELAKRYSRWLDLVHYGKHTKFAYNRAVRCFVEFLKDKSITRATHFDIRDFLWEESKRGLSYPTVCCVFYALHNFFSFLNFGGLVQRVTPRLVHMRPIPRRVPRSLSEGEVSRLISAAQTPRDRAIIRVLYESGCRVAELTNMKVIDINYERRRILVRGKGSKERSVVFGSGAAEALKTYLNGRETGYVFEDGFPVQKGSITIVDGQWIGLARVYGRQQPYYRKVWKTLGPTSKLTYDDAWVVFRRRTKRLNLVRPKCQRPLGTDAIRRIINILAIRARVAHATPHMLRHSFATHMFDRGAGIKEVQELLGHASIMNTEVYLKVSNPRLLETFDKYHPGGFGENTSSQAHK